MVIVSAARQTNIKVVSGESALLFPGMTLVYEDIMDYQEKTGLFTRTIPAKKEGEEDTTELICEFTFEYEERNGHPAPYVTVAVVPFRSVPESALEVGLGWTFCSLRDNPNKAKGRSIAQARAVGAIQNKKSTHITTRNGREIGFVALADVINVGMMREAIPGIQDRTINRVLKAIEHLVHKGALAKA